MTYQNLVYLFPLDVKRQHTGTLWNLHCSKSVSLSVTLFSLGSLDQTGILALKGGTGKNHNNLIFRNKCVCILSKERLDK